MLGKPNPLGILPRFVIQTPQFKAQLRLGFAPAMQQPTAWLDLKHILELCQDGGLNPPFPALAPFIRNIGSGLHGAVVAQFHGARLFDVVGGVLRLHETTPQPRDFQAQSDQVWI